MKKVLMIIGGIVVGILILVGAIFGIVSLTSEKMKCKSSIGNITIMYTGDAITGYTASNISYNLDGQKALAKRVGIKAYLDEFEDWFEENTDGTCKR